MKARFFVSSKVFRDFIKRSNYGPKIDVQFKSGTQSGSISSGDNTFAVEFIRGFTCNATFEFNQSQLYRVAKVLKWLSEQPIVVTFDGDRIMLSELTL